MKKVLSIVCILMLCLPAVAQKKSSSKSSSKSSVATSSYSGSRASSAPIKQKGKIGITADLGFQTGSTINTGPDGAGGINTTITPDRTMTFNAGAGVSYFVLERLEIGGTVGYSLSRTWLGLDTDGTTNLYRRVGRFEIAPYVGFHIPICSWCHYVPKVTLGFGIGSIITDLQLVPTITRNTGTSTRVYTDLAALNFEFLVSKKVSLTLDLGGIAYTSVTNTPAPNTKITTNTFAATFFNRNQFGVRYYFN
ncbi:MAG: hypothetical protein J6X69_03220 [Bacteroidales bacterium]|nr:hypothetical protein [Bacteroidales bacterium]